MLQLIARVVYEGGHLIVEVPSPASTAMNVFIEKLRGGPALIDLRKWYNRRSTGWKSQSHHLWGHASQLGEHFGYDKSTMLYLVADMVPSWPRVTWRGSTRSTSESQIDMYTAAEAIETMHRIAAEEGVNLREE